MPATRARRDQRGQTLGEYAVLLGLLVAAALVVGTMLFVAVRDKADEGVKLIERPAPAVPAEPSAPAGGVEVTVPGP